MTPSIQKHSCAACARRKVKCDKLTPCSNCARSQSECVYRAPAPSQRHRKRPAEEHLLSKISEYEDLLRENNVSFQPLHNAWIPSPLEEKLVSRPPTTPPGSCAPLQVPRETEWPPQAPGSEQQSQPELLGAQSEATRLWWGLPKELRDSPMERLKRPGNDLEDEVIATSSSAGIATSLLIPVRLSGVPQPLELHPEPKHIFKLWQAFADNVNPLTKVIHTPTLQQRILETSWNLETVTRPLEAVMFGVYALAITSMKPPDCVQAFGETRSVLLNRYRSGAAQALIAAELHATRDLEVLQALVLFLLLDPRSGLSVTAVAIATRIGHKMGLHRTGTDPHMPVFEQEMRLRVWWQIMGLESRARRKALGLKPPVADYGDVKMPMNVNDAELHPHMAHRPAVEHPRATEMLYCLLKYEVAQYVRAWFAAAPTTNPYELAASTSPDAVARKRKVLADLEHIYEAKYLRHCDPRIPLHHVSATVARLTIHRLRFWSYHPRHQPPRGQPMSPADQDALFESSIRLLQLPDDVRATSTSFSPHLLDHQLACPQVEALVYMVSELRRRVAGDLVRTAWTLVAKTYAEHPQLLQHDEDDADADADANANAKFCAALAHLTLQAWEARRHDAHGDAAPPFIGALQAMRATAAPEAAPTPAIDGTPPDAGFPFGWIHDDPLDWVYWDALPQL